MKKLYKSSTNKKIMGVCAGIADYLGIDPTIVRLVVGVAFFIYGIGFIPYIILGIILPYDYQVSNDRYRPQDGYVYRNNSDSTNSGRGMFSSMYNSQQPKDVTPKKDEDPWDDF